MKYYYYCCRELKRATAYKGDICSIFSAKKLFGTNQIAVKQDQWNPSRTKDRSARDQNIIVRVTNLIK